MIAAIHSYLAQLVTQTLQYQAQIKQAAQRQLNTAEQQTARQLSQIQSQTIGQLTALRKDSDYAWRSIQQSAQRQVKQAVRLTAERYTQTQTLAHQQLPSRVLKQGYTMLTDARNKQILTSSTQLYPEQTVNIILKDGNAKAQIIDITMDKKATKATETSGALT